MSQSGLPDLYELLAIPRSATADEVKAAYRRASKATHPDSGGNPGLFRAVNHAYAVLSDPAARRAYDAQTQTGQSTPPPSSSPSAKGGAAQARREQEARERAARDARARAHEQARSDLLAQQARERLARQQAAERAWRLWVSRGRLEAALALSALAIVRALVWPSAPVSLSSVADSLPGVVIVWVPAAALLAWVVSGWLLVRMPHGTQGARRASTALIVLLCCPALVWAPVCWLAAVSSVVVRLLVLRRARIAARATAVETDFSA